MTDEQFIDELRPRLGGGIVPIFKHPDGSINRLKTLELTVFDGVKLDERMKLLSYENPV